MKRRDFLKASIMTTATMASVPFTVESKTEKLKISRYQEIGKTGLKMSDISYGTGGLPSPSMILRAVDRGINYFDTAPDYGTSEKYIGQAMKAIQRDKIIIASKFCNPEPYPGHLPFATKKEDYIAAVEGSLSRLETDYLDFCFVHAIGEKSKNKDKEIKRLLDQEMLSAVDALKKAGKIRFLAVSSHGPNHMEDLLLTAVNSGHFDMIMPAFNFMKFPRIPEVLKEAKKKGIGVVAMKTLAGAKDTGIQNNDEPFEPAAFKWVLSHPEINGLIVTIKTVSHLDLYLTASGKKLTATDQKILERYAKRFNKTYCRTGCNQCESHCPQGVEMATTLRYQMYFKEYGMEKRAMASYTTLMKNAGDCLTCDKESCAGACPYGLPIKALLCEAHESLWFMV